MNDSTLQKDSTLHFTPNVRSSRINFDEVLKYAHSHISKLSDARQKKLKENLENGLGNLTNREQLMMYLASYGDIHRQKLLMAYEKLPRKMWTEDKISVIDYGCGQCIAEMVFADFLKEHYTDIDFVSDFTLIEPSRVSLTKGIEYVKHSASYLLKCIRHP